MATSSTAANSGRRIQLANLRRDKIHIPVAKAPACSRPDDPFLILGDSKDTDDRVGGIGAPPDAIRDESLQPSPVRILTASEWDDLGPLAHKIITDLVSQRRISKTELAA